MSGGALSVPLHSCPDVDSVDLRTTENDLRDLVRSALATCGVSIKSAALQQGLDISLFSKQLLGREGHVSFNRLARLEPAVLDEIAFRLAEARGHRVSRRDAHARRVRELTTLHRRLLELLAEDDQERRRA